MTYVIVRQWKRGMVQPFDKQTTPRLTDIISQGFAADCGNNVRYLI